MKRKKMPLRCPGIFYVFVVITSPNIAFSFDDEVTVFDVGQGNCVLVRHKKQAILIDAGSSEHQFSTLYDRLFGYDKQRYRLQGNMKTQNAETDMDTEEDDYGTSESSEDLGAYVESEGELNTDKAPNNQTTKKTCKKIHRIHY